MSLHGLSESQLSVVRSILSPYADRITKVGLFGSRATGAYRPNSDIDLVLYGQIDATLRDRIWSAFEASYLPIKVDVVAYDLITYPPFRTHIDTVMQPLWTQTELKETVNTRRIKLMADYDCFPLWEASQGVVGNIDPETLPISQALKSRLNQWAEQFDKTLNRQDPMKSGFLDISAKNGFEQMAAKLGADLQKELGSSYLVEVKI